MQKTSSLMRIASKRGGAWSVLLAALAATLTVTAASSPARAVDEAQAATKPAVTISIFTSTRSDACYDPGDAKAIRQMVSIERDRINARGGIAGHKLDVRILDDFRDAQKSIANVRAALDDPTAVAFVGLTSSDRSKAVFDAEGGRIKSSGIPFVSAIAVNAIFKGYPNVYTMRPSQDEERLPVMTSFVSSSGYSRVGFLGLKENVFSASLGEGLAKTLGARLVIDHRLSLKDEKLIREEVEAAIADLKARAVDMLFLGFTGDRMIEVMKSLRGSGLSPSLFPPGRLDLLASPEAADIVAAYPATIYELAVDRLPELYNDRLLRRYWSAPHDDWLFEGEKIASAPGWAKGECKERPAAATPDPLSEANLRAIGVGTQYADMLALIAAAARTADADAGIKDIRAHILSGLGTTYASGRGVFQGTYESWSFLPESRTATRTPFVLERPPGLGRARLAAGQYVRLRNDKLRPIETLYLDVDLIRLLRVDDSEQSFFAEFYLSMRDDGRGATIENIDFSNAFIDPKTNERQLNVRTISEGGKSETYPDNVKIYQVAGRFMFQPNLENYPFDSQRFAVDLRPKKGDAPFIIQPPPRRLRDQGVDADSWEPRVQYVGYDEDFVTNVDAKSFEQSVVPFYKASFVWLMSRETTDYYLRVVVPLAFILIVAYLSIFIPLAHFEAIVTIQVTALLSAVALYLSLPTIDADTATLSDRIFLFNYMAVSLMIGISIARMNGLVTDRPGLQKALAIAHVVAVPAMMGLMALYIWRISQAAL